MPQPNPPPRQVRLFRNNRNQAIRIPVEFELPGSEAIISRDGDRLIIEPVRKSNLEILASWEPLGEEFPDVDKTLPANGRSRMTPELAAVPMMHQTYALYETVSPGGKVPYSHKGNCYCHCSEQ